jgi:hypothetical protein
MINLWKIWMKCFGVINECLCFLWNIWVILIPLYLQHVQRLYLCFLWKLAHGSVLFYALLCFHENLIIIFWLDLMHMSLQFNWNMQICFFCVTYCILYYNLLQMLDYNVPGGRNSALFFFKVYDGVLCACLDWRWIWRNHSDSLIMLNILSVVFTKIMH